MHNRKKCGSNNLSPIITNEVSRVFCDDCGTSRILNDQDGGSTTTKNPGIEFVVPPGSSDVDIQLMKTLHEINTQTNENQRYDASASRDFQKALYGDKSQTGSGKRKKRQKRKNRKNKKHRSYRNKTKRRQLRKSKGGYKKKIMSKKTQRSKRQRSKKQRKKRQCKK